MRKKVIFEWFGIVMPMAEKYAAIKRAGFDGVMMWWGSDDLQYDDYLLNPELARKNGLFVENMHTPFARVNSLWRDGLEGEDYAANLTRYANDCSERGVPTMIVHISHGFDPPPMSEVGFDRLKRLVETAERKNVNVAIENLRRGDYTRAVFERIDSPRLKFCYDSGHANCFDAATDYLGLFGDKLAALHLHDNDGSSDMHNAPFTGTVDWARTMKKIGGAGYKGAISLEVFCGEGALPSGDADELLRLASESADKLEGLIE